MKKKPDYFHTSFYLYGERKLWENDRLREMCYVTTCHMIYISYLYDVDVPWQKNDYKYISLERPWIIFSGR